MSKSSFTKLIALLLIACVFNVQAKKCKPDCRWQCDDPVCPAKCHPVCERPQCEIQCEETPCAKCTVHCNRPVCDVRCPKDMCEEDNCPKCETVCHPANCYTTCVAPEPDCSPVCKPTECSWSCQKPTLCPKPKCELVCEKSDCEYKEPEPEKEKCCECTAEENAVAAIELANKAYSPSSASHTIPSFLEVLDGFRHNKDQAQFNTGLEKSCCPCAESKEDK